MLTKIPYLNQQTEHVKINRFFIIEQKDTTEPKSHATETLSVYLLSEYPEIDRAPFKKLLFTFDSWMQSVKLNKEQEMDHIYYSEDEHKLECLQKMINSIEDSFDENPPHQKARLKIEALKQCILTIKGLNL